MFKVNINSLKVMTNIGTTKKERSRKQLLLISITFFYKTPKNKDLDNINFLVSYANIKKHLLNFVKNSKYCTLEKLIVECKKDLKKTFKIHKIFLEIKKPKIAKKYRCESVSVAE